MKVPDKVITDYISEYIIKHGKQPVEVIVSNEAYAHGIISGMITGKVIYTLHEHPIFYTDYYGIDVHTKATIKIREESQAKERADVEKITEAHETMSKGLVNDYDKKGNYSFITPIVVMVIICFWYKFYICFLV